MKTYQTKTQVLNDLKGIIADTLCAGNGKEKVTETADLRKTFRVRNAEVGQLAKPLNKFFGCKLKPEEARKFQNAGDIIDWLGANGAICFEL